MHLCMTKTVEVKQDFFFFSELEMGNLKFVLSSDVMLSFLQNHSLFVGKNNIQVSIIDGLSALKYLLHKRSVNIVWIFFFFRKIE